MKKVAIYARVSTSDKQDFKRQIEDLSELIIKDGYRQQDIEVYSESISGYKDERPEMMRLLNQIKEDKNRLSRVYVSEISRIGRKPKKIRDIIEFLTDNGVDLYIQSIGQSTLNKDGSRNSVVNMIIQVLIEFAHSEAEVFKRRSRSGLLSSARAGKAGGGKYLPYGYKRDKNKMLIVDESEAETIELIFDLYLKGNGIKVISGILNNKSIPTRTNISLKGKEIKFKIKKNAADVRWSDKQIHDILKNPIYKGKRRYKGQERTKDETLFLTAPSIISAEIFDECTEIRKSKTHRNHSTTYVYLLKDRLICGCCGRNYFAKYKPNVGGDKVYICSSRLKKKGNCGNTGVNISLIESAIFNEIISSNSILKYINNKDEIKKRLEDEQEQLNNRISTNERLYAECIRQQKTLLNIAIKVDMNPDRYDKENSKLVAVENSLMDKINRERTEVRKIKKALKKHSDIRTTTEMLSNAKNNRSELRAIFLELLDKVIINQIDKNTILANVFLSIDQVVLPTSLRLFLDTKGIRKRVKDYRYLPMPGLDEAVKYQGNILKTPIQKVQEELEILNENAGLLDNDFVKIIDNNILSIPKGVKSSTSSS